MILSNFFNNRKGLVWTNLGTRKVTLEGHYVKYKISSFLFLPGPLKAVAQIKPGLASQSSPILKRTTHKYIISKEAQVDLRGATKGPSHSS